MPDTPTPTPQGVVAILEHPKPDCPQCQGRGWVPIYSWVDCTTTDRLKPKQPNDIAICDCRQPCLA